MAHEVRNAYTVSLLVQLKAINKILAQKVDYVRRNIV